MRRLALSVLTACGLAILSACSGGTGLSTGTGSNATVPTSISFVGDSGQVNDFFVSPTYTNPVAPSQAVAVTAIANKGSGPTALVVPNVSFTWAARFATAADIPSVNTYLTGPTPSGYKTCGFLAAGAATPAIPIYYQPAGQAGLAKLPATQPSSQVYAAPVAGVAAPYCIVLQATASPGKVLGAITVVVSNSP